MMNRDDVEILEEETVWRGFLRMDRVAALRWLALNRASLREKSDG